MDYYLLPIYVGFGVLPSLIWLLYYLRKDIHPEPKKTILKVFFFGIIATLPVFFVQVVLSGLLKQLQAFEFFTEFDWIVNILKWFFVIAFTEEIFKYLVVKATVLKSYELDEPLDVMIYMIVAALGFAAMENIFYILSPLNALLDFEAILMKTVTISFIRFIGATFLHTLASAVLGYFLARSFLQTQKKIRLTILGIVLAALLHGLYNFSIITLQSPMNFIVPVIIIGGLTMFMIYGFKNIRKLQSICEVDFKYYRKSTVISVTQEEIET